MHPLNSLPFQAVISLFSWRKWARLLQIVKWRWSENLGHFSSSDFRVTSKWILFLPSTFKNYLFHRLASDFPFLITPFSTHQELKSFVINTSVGSSLMLKDIKASFWISLPWGFPPVQGLVFNDLMFPCGRLFWVWVMCLRELIVLF